MLSPRWSSSLRAPRGVTQTGDTRKGVDVQRNLQGRCNLIQRHIDHAALALPVRLRSEFSKQAGPRLAAAKKAVHIPAKDPAVGADRPVGDLALKDQER